MMMFDSLLESPDQDDFINIKFINSIYSIHVKFGKHFSKSDFGANILAIAIKKQ